MKHLQNYLKRISLLGLALAMMLFVSCGGDDEPSVPDIRVAFSFSPENPEAGEVVTFTNASTGGTTFAWTFGDGGTSDLQSPTYTYEGSGTFTVTLTVDGNNEGAAANAITVGAPVPVISYAPETVESGSEITFSVEAYNPSNSAVTYAWDFGVEAEGESLTEGKSTEESPVVVFTAEAMVPVSVSVTVDGNTFSATSDVDVKGQLAKTLLFSAVDFATGSGSIFAKKLFDGFDAPAIDINVPTRSHPLTMRVANDRLYVFDAGVGLTFSTGDAAAADGLIFSTALADPTDYVSILDFTGGSGDYISDPFFGDVTDSEIYFADRRDGITAIDLTTANKTYTTDDFPYMVKNAELGYYSSFRTDGGPTYGWGALNGSVDVRDNGDIWWAKNSNHKGLWRFTESDITVTATVPALGGVLTADAVRAFELDEVNEKIYFSINKLNTNDMGMYVADMDGSNIKLIDGSRMHSEGGDSERTGITGIAVDAEGGYVYWGYRAPVNADPETAPLEVSGVKRWKIDGTGDVEIFVATDKFVYGLAIDQAKK